MALVSLVSIAGTASVQLWIKSREARIARENRTHEAAVATDSAKDAKEIELTSRLLENILNREGEDIEALTHGIEVQGSAIAHAITGINAEVKATRETQAVILDELRLLRDLHSSNTIELCQRIAQRTDSAPVEPI